MQPFKRKTTNHQIREYLTKNVRGGEKERLSTREGLLQRLGIRDGGCLIRTLFFPQRARREGKTSSKNKRGNPQGGSRQSVPERGRDELSLKSVSSKRHVGKQSVAASWGECRWKENGVNLSLVNCFLGCSFPRRNSGKR